MSWILSDSGTTSALTIGSETALATDTNNGTFVLEVDAANMANGDILQAKVYTITLSSETLIQAWKGTYQHVQINNHKISPPIASDQSIKCTLIQSGGTVTISSNLTIGTVPDGCYGVGQTSSAVAVIRTIGGGSISSATGTTSIIAQMTSSGTANAFSSGEKVYVGAVGSTTVSSANQFTMNGLPTGRIFAWKMLRI